MTRGYSMNKYIACSIVLAAFVFFWSAGHAAAELTVVANHDHISIDFFYHGSTVSVKGVTDPGTDVIIKIASPAGHESLKQKGKVGRVLWMNTGTLSFEHAPAFYEIFSSNPVDELLSKEEQIRHALGYAGLKEHIVLDPVKDNAERQQWLEQFIRFKEAHQLYRMSSGGITFAEKDGHNGYYILTEWPYQAKPGDYTVTAYAVKEGKVVDSAETTVRVDQAGIVKFLSNMARNNAAFYGLISIIIALSAGFGVGLVFRKGGGAH